MDTLKVYILPESYEVKSAALDDIKYVVNPTYTKSQVAKLDKENAEKYTLTNNKYLPGNGLFVIISNSYEGFVGINNLKANDYMNCVIQLLVHVPPLRNFFILEDLNSRTEVGITNFPLSLTNLTGSKTIQSHDAENMEFSGVQRSCLPPRIYSTIHFNNQKSIPL